ncbi:MAG: hypothetical protein AB7F89_26050, partial [Pirellulaceae bacterium]
MSTLALVPPSESTFRSLSLVQSSRQVVRLAKLLALGMLVSIAAMLLLPWQQTTAGSGRLVAYQPTERVQTVESPIYGRIVRWGEGIVEGAHVKAGQEILEIRDNDPGRADRLAAQVAAIQEKLTLGQSKAATYERQVADLMEARTQIIEASRQLVEEARRKLDAERHDVESAEAGVAQTRANFER